MPVPQDFPTVICECSAYTRSLVPLRTTMAGLCTQAVGIQPVHRCYMPPRTCLWPATKCWRICRQSRCPPRNQRGPLLANVTYFDSAKVRFAVPADPLAFFLNKSNLSNRGSYSLGVVVWLMMWQRLKGRGGVWPPRCSRCCEGPWWTWCRLKNEWSNSACRASPAH